MDSETASVRGKKLNVIQNPSPGIVFIVSVEGKTNSIDHTRWEAE